jgi:uncharacterized protein
MTTEQLTAKEIIDLLNLEKHPFEGGYYRRTYRSSEIIAAGVLPYRFDDDRPFANSIYYLLTPDTCSALHRIKSDEVYHFYIGDPVVLLLLFPDGSSRTERLGPDIRGGEKVQVTVPHGVWQGSFLIEDGRYALMGTTLAPCFDWPDLEMANRSNLLASYQNHHREIKRLTLVDNG